MRPIALMSALALAFSLIGCGDDDDDNGVGPSATAEFDVIQAGVDAYLESGSAPTISAQALFENLNDGDASNDPVIVSVRSPEHYAIGHIQGAINIPWREIADPANLARLSKDDDIVVYCYTGHTGGVATTALNAMGYSATNLKFGMMGWSQNADVVATTPFSDDTAPDYPTVTTPYEGGSYDLPDPDFTVSDAADEIMRAAVEATVTEKAPVISAQALFENLNDGDASNDPVILSVRSAEHYALGHIEGAINIPWKSIAQTEQLSKLPPDQQIAVYCYTGHTGAVATTALNLMGYNAVNVKFGMMGWTKDAAVRVAAPYSVATAPNFPTVP